MKWKYTKPNSKEWIKVLVFYQSGIIAGLQTMYSLEFAMYRNKDGFCIDAKPIYNVIAWAEEPKSPPVKKWQTFIKETIPKTGK